MEELTKHQLVLVSLLVSFVTSIATGIVMVTLVEQAPQGGVVQTVNRIIERTVETVSPSTPASVASTQSDTVTNEGDQVVAAVEKNSKSLVRIRGTVNADPPAFLGLGLVLSKDGMIATDKDVIEEGGSYIAVMSDGKIFDLDLIARNDSSKVAFFRARLDRKVSYRLYPAVLGNSNTLKLGQEAVVLAGDERNIISRSTITGLITNSDGSPSNIETDSLLNQVGEPLINLSGEVIGFKTRREGTNPADFLPINTLKDNLKALTTTTH